MAVRKRTIDSAPTMPRDSTTLLVTAKITTVVIMVRAPISADKVVLESSLSFAMAIQKLLVKNEACRLAGLYLFWNMVDGREKTDLYTAYDKTIKELKLPLMKTFIPDTKRYKKELVADKKAVFRSTLFPASHPLVRGSNLEELITEIVYYIKLQ